MRLQTHFTFAFGGTKSLFSCALFAVRVVQQGATEFALDLEAEVSSCLPLH